MSTIEPVTAQLSSSPKSTSRKPSELSTHMFAIPATPPGSYEASRHALSTFKHLGHKCVALTGITRFLPSHILHILLSKDFPVRGIYTQAEEELAGVRVDSMFESLPQARKFLFLRRVEPLDQMNWERALEATTHVIHMVAPLTAQKTSPKSMDPTHGAVRVTKCLLKACVKVKSIQRIIFITSTATISWSKDETSNVRHYNEESWENEKNLTGTAKCELICEKIAWDFIHCLPESDKKELVVLNPASMLGPVLGMRCQTTALIDIIKAMMENSCRSLPCVNIPYIDVRDVAQATVIALVNKDAVGRRHILYCSSICPEDLIRILQLEFSKQGYNVMPIHCVRERICCSWCFKRKFPPNLSILEEITTRSAHYDNTRMREVLNVEPRVPEETIIETAYSLIFWDLINRGKSAHDTVKPAGSGVNFGAVSTSHDSEVD